MRTGPLKTRIPSCKGGGPVRGGVGSIEWVGGGRSPPFVSPPSRGGLGEEGSTPPLVLSKIPLTVHLLSKLKLNTFGAIS